ncbi:MAG TPA: DNA-binding domain-containing protein [Thermoanaerobaculia bacterium]
MSDRPSRQPAAALPRPPLDVVQQWFQAVVTHPAGVAAGASSPAAQRLVRLDRGSLEQLVRRSRRLTAEQRLEIYANAYYARLLECLRDTFPALTRVLGAEAFDSFAFDYLQRYPSRSYTLYRLAESFPRFLDETRPEQSPAAGTAGPAWPDFLIDLATLELAIAEAFDGPGAEGEPLLAAADLLARRAGGDFAKARLAPVPCLRLLRFSHPVNAFYSSAMAMRSRQPVEPPGLLDTRAETAAADLPVPDPGAEHIALSRTDYVVRRYPLTPFEAAVLAALVAGATVGDAIAGAAAASELPDDELAAQLDAAFRRWTAAGFFRATTS